MTTYPISAPAQCVELPLPADSGLPPPVACTLTGADQAGRVEEWRRLLSQADGRQRVDGGLAFRFPAGLAAQIAGLAAAEQRCCPFLEFALHFCRGELRLEVQVPDDAAPMLADMFGV